MVFLNSGGHKLTRVMVEIDFGLIFIKCEK